MTAPLVSVCIPVRNGEAHLEETLSSVLSQEMADLEVVVCDNASADRSVEIVRSHSDPRIRLMRNDADIGGIANWNRVAAEARGRYVKLLAADDILYVNCLADQVLKAEDPENADVVMVASLRDIIDQDGRVLLRDRGLGRLSGRVAGPRAIRDTVRSGTNLFGEPHCVLFRRAALPAEGAFIAARSYMVDLDLWCRLLELGDLYAQRTAVGAFRVHGAAESVRMAGQQARHAEALFRDLEASGRITAVDRRSGVARARGLAMARRALYAALRARATMRQGNVERP